MQALMKKKFRTKGYDNGAGIMDARIICVDADHPDYPIVALVRNGDGNENPESYTTDLKYIEDYEGGDMDLVEVNPYADLAVDAPVVCWDDAHPSVLAWAHFAKVSEDGKPMTYYKGKTSFTNKGINLVEWDNCVPYEEYLDMQKTTNQPRNEK